MGTRDRAREARGQVEGRELGDASSCQRPLRTGDSERPPAYDVGEARSVVVEPGLGRAGTVYPPRGV